MTISNIYAEYHARQRKQRIIDACIIGLFLLSTTRSLALSARMWHLLRVLT